MSYETDESIEQIKNKFSHIQGNMSRISQLTNIVSGSRKESNTPLSHSFVAYIDPDKKFEVWDCTFHEGAIIDYHSHFGDNIYEIFNITEGEAMVLTKKNDVNLKRILKKHDSICIDPDTIHRLEFKVYTRMIVIAIPPLSETELKDEFDAG